MEAAKLMFYGGHVSFLACHVNNGSAVAGKPSACALPGHVYEPSPSRGLEETSRSPSQHVGRSSEKRRERNKYQQLGLGRWTEGCGGVGAMALRKEGRT